MRGQAESSLLIYALSATPRWMDVHSSVHRRVCQIPNPTPLALIKKMRMSFLEGWMFTGAALFDTRLEFMKPPKVGTCSNLDSTSTNLINLP